MDKIWRLGLMWTWNTFEKSENEKSGVQTCSEKILSFWMHAESWKNILWVNRIKIRKQIKAVLNVSLPSRLAFQFCRKIMKEKWKKRKKSGINFLTFAAAFFSISYERRMSDNKRNHVNQFRTRPSNFINNLFTFT